MREQDGSVCVFRLRRRLGRFVAAGGVVLVFSLTPAGGVRSSEAGFVALLGQTMTYLNILIDEWEKYSRILEDHLDKVTGVLQPFSDIHAGIREVTDLNGLRGVYRMTDAYRASVTDPACWNPSIYNAATPCALQREFTPPEAYEVWWEARHGLADGRYTFERLEGRVFDRSPLDTVQEAVMPLLQAHDPGSAAEVRRTQARVERNVERNRWRIRRIRTLGNRARYAARNFQRWGGAGRAVAGAAGCGSIDVSVPEGADGVSGTHDDPTILDQALNADCLDAAAHLDRPLTEQAHLSEMEAKTLRAAGIAGLVEMAAVDLEQEAVRNAAAVDSAERVEEQRRRALTRLRRRLDCVGVTGSFAYVGAGGACGAVLSAAETRRRHEAQDVSMRTW